MKLFDFIFRNRFLSLFSGYLLLLVVGTTYLFSLYAPFIKDTFKYDQTQIEFVNTIVAFSQYLSPLNGIFYDFCGPRWSVLLGGFFNFLGYFLVWLALKNTFRSNNILVGFFLMLCGFGRGFAYYAALGANLEHFDQRHHGKILGSLLALLGGSAAIFTGIYKIGFNSDVDKFLLFLGGFTCALCTFSAIFIFRMPREKQRTAEEQSLINSSPEDTPDGDNYLSNLQKSLPVLNPLRLLLDLNFWILTITFTVATGVGLMVVANIGMLILSLGKPESAQDIYVTIFSICNAVGRFGVGVSGDVLAKVVNRPIFYTLSIALIGCGQLLMAFGNLALVGVGIALVGFSFGSVWGVVPCLVRELYGQKYYGTNLAICEIGAGLGSYLFGTLLSARIYQSHTQNGSIDCFGVDCFQWTFLASAICCGGATVLSLLLLLRTRKLYSTLGEINQLTALTKKAETKVEPPPDT